MNNRIKQNFLICLVLMTVFFLSSCKKEGSIVETKLDENYIDLTQAKSIAVAFAIKQTVFAKKIRSEGISVTIPNAKTIKTSVAIKMDNKENAFYIINYEESGFSVISADRRTPKILAFSDKGNLNVDTTLLGITGWIENIKAMIKGIRDENVKYTGQDKNEIYSKSNGYEFRNPPVDTTCMDEFEEIQPMLETEWRQEAGYNQLMPYIGCGPDNKAYTGCVTTAIAQIVKYHEYPNWYNYSIMPNDIATNYYTTGAQEIAALMAYSDSTLPIPTFLSIKYDCSGTYTDASNAVGTFINYFGYSNTAQSLSYASIGTHDVVLNNLRVGKPVLFSGGRANWMGVYVDGHAWVCDGFIRSFQCLDGGYTGAAEFLYLHHNWGYGPGNGNGFYLDPHFYALGRTFNYQTKVIVNIEP